jgi:predicted RNA-binding Zn-ribbon protein involved in translation (DUF1610 family)
MSDSVRDLLVRGIAAAKANDEKEARFYLEWALRLDPTTEQTVDAFFWLSEISADPQEKRDYLEEVLVHQPTHYRARRSMAILDGRLDPKDIVDPNQIPSVEQEEQHLVQAQRFECPNCGGRLSYAPDGKSLVCDYCQARERVSLSQQSKSEAERDFTIALATAHGHTKPVAMRSFDCQACGAVYMLSPQSLSMTCPYCASVYVVEHTQTLELIPPEEMLPFNEDGESVQKRLRDWMKKQKLPAGASLVPPRGFYLPVWAFTISGVVPYQYWDDDDDKPKSGSKLFSYRNVLVPASSKIPEMFLDEVNNYQLEEMVPYDPAYLAAWPAETYQISLSDASLKARWKTLERARRSIRREISKPVRELNLNSMDLLIETFKLILLPLWMANYRHQGESYLLIVNGQTGKVRGQEPAGKERGWLARLFEDE